MRKYADRLLGTLRSNVTPVPFSVVRDHFNDLDTDVETILLIQKGHDLAEITAALYKAQCRGDWEQTSCEMLYDGQIKIVVHAPTNMPIDLWPFYVATYDIPGDQRCMALYIKPVYFVQFVDSPGGGTV